MANGVVARESPIRASPPPIRVAQEFLALLGDIKLDITKKTDYQPPCPLLGSSFNRGVALGVFQEVQCIRK